MSSHVSHSKYLRCLHGTAAPTQQAAADDAEWMATRRAYMLLGLCAAWNATTGRLCGAAAVIIGRCAEHCDGAYGRPQRGAQR